MKSIGLLQAYGEFERFMHMSKQHIKQQRKEMRAKRQHEKNQIGTEAKNEQIKLYREIQATMKPP